ncbi:MAG TPA: hypothetical protein VD884_17600 [Ohtaekwangia sp.]|nr:hypothetical protein [Ohtaekwangia sp.]
MSLKFIALLALLFFSLLTCELTRAQQIIESRRQASADPLFRKDKSTLDLPDPKLIPLVTSFDVMLRPEDFEAGNVIAPRISGSFSKSFLPDESKFKLNYQFNLQLQSPQTTRDSTAMLSRLLSSGAVGNISGSISGGITNADKTSGALIAIFPTLSWQNSQVLEDATPGNFQYYSTRASITLWTGPIIGVFQASYSTTLGEAPSFIDNSLNRKWICNALLGMSIAENFFLQAKLLLTDIKVPEGKEASSQEKFELSIVRTLAF